jgi:hypothetical protein
LARFPPVRKTLERWQVLAPGSRRSALFDRLTMRVTKVSPRRRSGGSQHDPDRKQKPDLVVLATRGKHGLPLWLKPSISKAIARRTKAMTLFVPRGCRGTSSTLSGSSCAG